MLSGIVPGHDEVLTSLGVADKLRSAGLVFADTPAAISRARRLLSPTGSAHDHEPSVG